jgi:IS1 family transposase
MIPMYKLSITERAQILTSLAEGNSIASTCRMLDVNKITVLRLLADAGTLAQKYHDLAVYDLPTKRVQVDEIWSYVFAKRDHITPKNHQPGRGDCWTWVAMDSDSKLVITWFVGNRGGAAANEFVADLADRLANRVQMTSDGWDAYRTAVARAFGSDIDYAMLIKNYAENRESEVRYSPPVVTSIQKIGVSGQPGHKAYQHVPCRAAESDHANVNAAVHAADKRFFQKD